MDPSPLPNPLQTAAQQFGERGLRLLPVAHHSREAILNKWQQNAGNDPALLERWFAEDNNVGLCCGPQPAGWNLLCIDIDNRETWGALERQHGPLDREQLVLHRSPSGGAHLFFDVPPGYAITGTDVFGPGIDARGGAEGNVGCGYVLLPPSVAASKKTGELLSYGASPGKGLLDRAPMQAPQWILGMIEAYLAPTPRESVERHPSNVGGDTPGDWVRANLSWEQYLLKHGWQQKGNGRYWTRPGKSVREGHSAELHEDGRLAIWTGEVPDHLRTLGARQSDGGISISLYDFIAAYEFGGDRAALGGHVRLRLMPPPPSGHNAQAVATEGEADGSAADFLDDSWYTFVDLTPHMDGTFVQVTPTILRRTDGIGLFYPGVLNGIHGESGLGKGWVALSAVVDVVREGGVAVYVDLEDTPTSIAARLRHLGLTQEQITAQVKYARPTDPTSPETIKRLVAAVTTVGACLVVIDSLGEAFGLDGINENNDNEVAPWLRSVGRGLADTGACVIIIDHVTKSVDNPLYAKGSARKRAQIGGTSFLVEALQPLTKGKGGKLRLTCAKDRYGTFTRGQVAAEVVFNASGPDDMLVRIYPPAGVDVVSPQEKQDNDVIDCAVDMMKVIGRKKIPFTKTLICKETARHRNEIKYVAFEHLVTTGRVVSAGSGKWQQA
jgi:hypothetical protein